MVYNKQLDDRFFRFEMRVRELEQAVEAHDRAFKHLEEELGVEIDLKREPHPAEVLQDKLLKEKYKRRAEDAEALALLESQEDDDQ